MSDYSPTSYLVVASVPSQANRPVFVQASDSGMTLTLELNVEQFGQAISEHELSVSADGYSWQVITNYDG
jgi:hypothetical protein